MKNLISFLLILICSSSLIAQERYFHELKGFEDSSETTQLFYRLHESPDTGNDSSNFLNNNIFHFDTESEADSILLRSYYYEWTLPGMYTRESTYDYDFYTQNPSSWIRMTSTDGGAAPWFQDYRNAGFGFPFPIVIKAQNIHEYYNQGTEFLLSTKNDSLYYLLDDITIPFSSDTALWPNFVNNSDTMISYFDSTHFDYELLSIHPTIDSLYFGINSSGHLFRSEEYSSDFVLADSSIFYSALFFDSNPSYIYGRNQNNLRISNDGGVEDSWTQITLPDDLNRLLFATTDTSVSGSLFLADSNSVFSSTNFGSTFQKILDFNTEITGLYKKPNSKILYVLTKTDLYKVENGQPTSIKQVPVSNEENPEIPTSVSLKQNYPNPFNPSTTIQFELDKAAFTKLTVYDVLGRKVQELVNDVRPAGTNTIQFDATNLASGVYLYRLEASGVVQTKRLTLIK